MNVRRVVTGQRADGTSVFVSDEQVEPITAACCRAPRSTGCGPPTRWYSSPPTGRRATPPATSRRPPASASASSRSARTASRSSRTWTSAPHLSRSHRNCRDLRRRWSRPRPACTRRPQSITTSSCRAKCGWSLMTAPRCNCAPVTASCRTARVTPGATSRPPPACSPSRSSAPSELGRLGAEPVGRDGQERRTEACANMCEESRHGRTLLSTCDQGPSIQRASDHVCRPISPA